MTLLRELIDIPEHVRKGDFVLRLSEGVIDPAGTLGEYVVTLELVRCFDQALDFIRAAVTGRTSKATYLHGSFGAGKSHFMAVLHLILQGNAQARGIPELAAVIAKHNDWLSGKKFLLALFHKINSHSMESGILGGYVGNEKGDRHILRPLRVTARVATASLAAPNALLTPPTPSPFAAGPGPRSAGCPPGPPPTRGVHEPKQIHPALDHGQSSAHLSRATRTEFRSRPARPSTIARPPEFSN